MGPYLRDLSQLPLTLGVRATTDEFEGVTNTQSITVYLQCTLLTIVFFSEKYTTTPTWKMFLKEV